MAVFLTKKFWIKQIILWLTLVSAFFALMIPVPVKSQSVPANAQPEVINPCDESDGLGGCLNGFEQFDRPGSDGPVALILNISRILTFISGAIAVLFIVYAGFLMVTSSGDKGRYEDGLKTLKNAIIGLIVAILAYTIVTLVGNVTQSDILTVTNNNS